MKDSNPTSSTTGDPIAILRWVRNQIVDLCEATGDDDALCHVAGSDLEGKQGAFARGRIHEAKAICNAMAEVIRGKIREVESSDGRP